jgi:hypothetical protein
MIQYLGYPASATRWRGLRQVLQTLAKIFFGLAVVEGWRTSLLTELVSRLVQEHSDMSVGGRLQSEKLLQPALPMCGFQQIGTPDHMSELRFGVINGSGQLVGIEAVAALHNEIF